MVKILWDVINVVMIVAFLILALVGYCFTMIGDLLLLPIRKLISKAEDVLQDIDQSQRTI